MEVKVRNAACCKTHRHAHFVILDVHVKGYIFFSFLDWKKLSGLISFQNLNHVSNWVQPLQIKEAQKGPRLLLVISKVFATATYQDHTKSHFQWLANQERLESGMEGDVRWLTEWALMEKMRKLFLNVFFFLILKWIQNERDWENVSSPAVRSAALCLALCNNLSHVFGVCGIILSQSRGGKADCFAFITQGCGTSAQRSDLRNFSRFWSSPENNICTQVDSSRWFILRLPKIVFAAIFILKT